MITTDNVLLAFWGKTPARATDPPTHFHPALYHMLDVAFVAEALLSAQGAPRLRQALRHAWDGCDAEALCAWLPFLVATHDLGKVSAAFQGQAREQRTLQQRERLEQEHGISFPAPYEKAPYHAEISAVWLHHHLIRREPGTARRLMWALRDAMGGHHGRFTQEDVRKIRARLTASEQNAAHWEEWRDATYTLLRQVLNPPGTLAEIGAPQRLRPATAALTGFIILSDWIGSNSNYFPAVPRLPLDAYIATMRERAAQAISLAGLVDSRPAPIYVDFSHLFPPPLIADPRPLQLAIDDLPTTAFAVPLLVVIEAPTGEGKTEAALALAQRLAVQTGQDELFFALPTMATSNQIFQRLSAFYERQYGAAVRLTHSQSLVVEKELRRAALAGDHDAAAPAATSALAAIEWFAGSKKAMLAPFGVGTVDQVELAGLNVRHYMLRLFALAGKVVIVDEVHAYDAYMSVILEHTLTWLASLGTSVLLLSATLPATRHRALVASYMRGLDKRVPVPEIPADLAYPAISLYRAGTSHRATPNVFRPDQHFTLRMVPRLEPEEDAQALIDLVREGGAVARICNRVDDAQAIYRALQDRVPSEQRLLLHARFPLDQRQRLEQEVHDCVGKATSRPPDQPLIIVGTQVLEQSLDYDVDVMVSDFAPIDLLLQRAGRLHRHVTERAGKRPPRHAQPVLSVVLPLQGGSGPMPDDGLPDWNRWAKIYDPYILWRTWEVLCHGIDHDTREIVLPRDYRMLIEAVYQDQPQCTPDTAYTDAMHKAWAQLQQLQGELRAQARRLLTPPADRNDAITEAADIACIEDQDGALAGWKVAKTRLGDRITVVPLYRVDGTLALDRGGTWCFSPDVPPDLDGQRDLISRSVGISDPRIIAEFRAGTHPDWRWPWPASEVPSLLRSLFPLVLNAQDTAMCDRRRIYLDTELGLLIEKENV